MNQPTPEMVDAAANRLPCFGIGEYDGAIEIAEELITAALAVDPLRTGITVHVAPGVTLHGDTGAFTATADAPPAAVARLLRDLADDLDRQEPLHEWQCPACGATTRARMADQEAAR